MKEHEEHRHEHPTPPGAPAPEGTAPTAPTAPGAEDGGTAAAAPPASPEPPKGPRALRLAVLLVLALALLWAGHAFGGFLAGPLARAWDAISPSDTSSTAEDASGETQYYTCGMHPWVVLPGPGKCPVCRMELTPIDPSKFTGEITIDPVITQNIGVRVAPVINGPLTRTVRTVGKVDYDETAVRDINTRVDGWVEELHVDYVGARVEAGQPLFDLFSRELYSAQEEYLIAWRAAQQGSRGVEFVPDVQSDGSSNLEAARTRLSLFGITRGQIEELERAGKVSRTMTITSPYSGLVTEKHASEGMRVTPGTMTYRIADLSRVWVFVTLYEYQLPFVQEGQEAVMTLPYLPGQTFEGRVAYVYPWLEEKTREVRVRLEFANPNLLLKPGMFATVQLRARLANDRTLAPREAIIDTGERAVAFVSKGAGKFEPREVKMGVQAEHGMVEVLSGLRPGELVVTSGQFLLDSEAKIREALGKMIRGEMASEQDRIAVVERESELESLPQGVAKELDLLLRSYFEIGSRLAADSTEGTAAAGREIARAVDRLLRQEIPGHPRFWQEHDEIARVRGKALELAAGDGIEDARLHFGDMSVALTELLGATGVPPDFGAEVRELHCPMFREGQGGSTWLQPAGDVHNPFFGSLMPECFDREASMPVTGERLPEREAGGPPGATDGRPPAPPIRGADASAGGGSGASTADGGEALDRTVTAYLALQSLLASADEPVGLGGRVDDLLAGARRLADAGQPALRRRARPLVEAASAVPDDVAGARESFKAISRAMGELVAQALPSEEVAPSLHEFWCPMAQASWLQVAPETANPYYGPGMHSCGSIRKTIRGGAGEDAR